jgi:integrase
MATTAKPFRVKYAPPGMTWAEAKAAGALRESDVWMIRYRVHGRPRRESTGTTSYEEAKRILRERLSAADHGEAPARKARRVTVSEMAAALERDYTTNGQRLDTLKARLGHLNASPALGYGLALLAELTPRDMEAYKAERLDQKASGATINRELYVLAHMIARGRDLGHVTGSLRVRAHKMAESPARSGFFEPGQFQAVMAALPKHLRPVVAFGYETGWRLREITSRRWRHVDLKAGVVRLEPGESKSGKPREIFASPELLAILRAQLAKAATKWPGERLDDRPVFFRPGGLPVSTFRKAWATACETANVAGRIFHDLRRTAARDMVRSGTPERVAMTVTGHETRDVFERYNIVSEQDRRDVAARNAGRLPVAVAVGETKSTTARTTRQKPALRLIKAGP